MIIAGCQRWRERRESYVPARELFNPRAHEVAPLAQDLAKAFVEANHYSGSCSARTRQFGLYSGSDLVGVAVFGEPGGPKVKAILPCPAAQTLELGRLVLLEGVLANAESWFVARCFDQLRRAGYGGVISFADPLPRTTIAGKVVFGGHAGTIYQSLNAGQLGTDGGDRPLRGAGGVGGDPDQGRNTNTAPTFHLGGAHGAEVRPATTNPTTLSRFLPAAARVSWPPAPRTDSPSARRDATTRRGSTRASSRSGALLVNNKGRTRRASHDERVSMASRTPKRAPHFSGPASGAGDRLPRDPG